MCFFSSVFLTILQIFSLEVTLIHDQGWINVGAYGPLTLSTIVLQQFVRPSRVQLLWKTQFSFVRVRPFIIG